MAVTDKHYSSARGFFGSVDSNMVSAEDKERLQAYEFYEDAYHNNPEGFSLTLRGQSDDATEIHLPSVRKMVEAVNNFLAVKFNFVVDPGQGSPEDRATIERYIKNLWKRENFYGKFANNKRYALIRGDAMVHITADDTKPDGKRISIHELHPKNYFPIMDPNISDRVMGCHIVDQVKNPQEPDKLCARRQTYRRLTDELGNPTGIITSELTLWTLGKWDDRNLEPADMEQISTVRPAFELPSEISQIPVYHIRNNAPPGRIFGKSQVAGVETIVNGLNQAATDEDLALVMAGLGMYWTNANGPTQDDGVTPAPWNLGPGQVVSVGENQTFGRIPGVGSVAPSIDHMKYIDEYAQRGLGIPDIAAGIVDVAVAESGVSRMLQFAPLLKQCGEKEIEILLVHDQMLYDLVQMWLPAYEGINCPDVEVASVVADAMPRNDAEDLQELLLLFSAGVIPMGMVHSKLNETGRYDFSDQDVARVIAEQAKLSSAKNGDPFDNRWGEEKDAK